MHEDGFSDSLLIGHPLRKGMFLKHENDSEFMYSCENVVNRMF